MPLSTELKLELLPRENATKFLARYVCPTLGYELLAMTFTPPTNIQTYGIFYGFVRWMEDEYGCVGMSDFADMESMGHTVYRDTDFVPFESSELDKWCFLHPKE